VVLQFKPYRQRMLEAMATIRHRYPGAYFDLEEAANQSPTLIAYWRPDGDREVRIGPVK
jgi:hypothetical protein